jgi:hypothetical protein
MRLSPSAKLSSRRQKVAKKKIEEVKRKRVAIVGCSDSKKEAPFDDTEWEIWGVNNLYPMISRADRWFEIHSITHDGKQFLRRGEPLFRGQKVDEYLKGLGDWAKKQNCRVYMQQKWDVVPTSEVYPVNEIIAKFGDYFTNSISWMIALAISEGFEEIAIYGVDMAVDTEYHHQRPSCEYIMGVAAGLGIKVHIPHTADLLKTRFLYGFQEPEELAWNKKVSAMRKSMKKKRAALEQQRMAHEAELKAIEAKDNQYIGAIQCADEMKKVWG